MNTTTRAALPEEMSIVRQLYDEAMKAYIECIWGWDQSWQDTDFAKAFVSSVTYLIETDSIISGYFQVELGEKTDYLRMLILKPETRSIGIGAKVLSEILKISHDGGKNLMLRVFKINTGAKRFYEREGWTVVNDDDEFFLMENQLYPEVQPNLSFQRTAKSYVFFVR
ncbi:hypothetical protein SCT_2065 [Sulfuricella sp. T08]|uniref:GNAT family N-acetyltransferase n=1 Tax=Sulfuricella sp. T08 TaxID=1632857 RepID=UPI000617A1C2|nr:GNAT family N-acetyltransferase [Sulfuricella sp. T08]GAO36655.1 hypothetical protein SCT_2065 [Sulfuricella sp. T08]